MLPITVRSVLTALQRHSFGTLVVCVPNTLVQWEDEVKKMCPDLKVYKYHGDCRTKSATR